MKLYFTSNVNDKYHNKVVYLKGKTYMFDKKRAQEILDAVPEYAHIADDVPEKKMAKKDNGATKKTSESVNK